MTPKKKTHWLRSTLTDKDGDFDVAYVSLFSVMGGVLGAILLSGSMSVVAFFMCVEHLTTNPPVLCRYDPLPLGQAVGLICSGFGVALGALAGYMAATRKPKEG